MIGTTIWHYIFIRACIFFLHSIAALSVLYCTIITCFRLFKLTPFRIPWVLEAWVILEAAFYILVYLPRRSYLQNAAIHPKPLNREQRHALFQQCHNNVPDPERYLSRWFLGAPALEIKRENIKDFFCWAFLNKADYDSGEEEEELEEYVGEMEKHLQRKVEEGRGNAKSLRLTLDRVDMLHRSLTWYLCVFVVDMLASMSLLWHSFQYYGTPILRPPSVFPFRPLHLLSPYRSPSAGLTYWHRPHKSKTRLPILFIHGIGIGLYPYVNFLAELNAKEDSAGADGELGVIAVEIMPVSSRITTQALGKTEMCREILDILKAHGWNKFVLVSHSYGSVISTHLLHTPEIAERIGPILLIDPVSIMLHLPDVAYNFASHTRRKPSRPNEYQLYYFASKDMGISHTLARRFFWSENILWKEDVQGRHLTVSFGGKDLLMDTETIGAYLAGADKKSRETGSWKERAWKGEGLDLLWFQELDHAQVFDRRATRRLLAKVVRAYCAQH
ncbi:MAG: hypothetical protein M1839_009442 [Geoglossum umbratile]|nr:MAG: hypothetical protein M1839_009442 [Geoglossum umbratile]